MQNPKYSFPILRNAEILQCLQDLQISFAEEDLTKPTPQRIMQLYETFTDFLMGVTREQFSQPSFNVLQTLEYPDLHMEGISALGFYKQLWVERLLEPRRVAEASRHVSTQALQAHVQNRRGKL